MLLCQQYISHKAANILLLLASVPYLVQSVAYNLNPDSLLVQKQILNEVSEATSFGFIVLGL